MSGVIHRDPEGTASQDFDLIVVGGGIHGIMVALEATRRRLRPLLIERGDFAGATSHNSLRARRATYSPSTSAAPSNRSGSGPGGSRTSPSSSRRCPA